MRSRALAWLLVALAAGPAFGFGKNKIHYDDFDWHIYTSPHFEVYYYTKEEQHLGRVVSYAESAYFKISEAMDHKIPYKIPLVFYQTHSEFEQTNIFPAFIIEGIAAFAEPYRNRMVLPIDDPPDELQTLIEHELTHIFQYNLLYRTLVGAQAPPWVWEGHANFISEDWTSMDRALVRDAVLNNQLPTLEQLSNVYAYPNVVLGYNLGASVFDFMAERYGKKSVSRFFFNLNRAPLLEGGDGKSQGAIEKTFKLKPEKFTRDWHDYLEDIYKLRDQDQMEDPDDAYGEEIKPPEPFESVLAFAPSPSGELLAALSYNKNDYESDLILISARDGRLLRNLTEGYTNDWEYLHIDGKFFDGRSLTWDPSGDRIALFARAEKRRKLLIIHVISGALEREIPMELEQVTAPAWSPDGSTIAFRAINQGQSDIFLLDLASGATTNLTQDDVYEETPLWSPDGQYLTYTGKVNLYDKLFQIEVARPQNRIQLTFGDSNDRSPSYSSDGGKILFSSDRGGIFNVFSLDLTSGDLRRLTAVTTANLSPAPIVGEGKERIGFLCYWKGDWSLRSIAADREPIAVIAAERTAREAEQEALTPFAPAVQHEVLEANKQKKGMFSRFNFETAGRSIGVTSGGDFFANTAIVFSDILVDSEFLFLASTVREFQGYLFQYSNRGGRWYWGSRFQHTTDFFFGTFDLVGNRDDALATQRLIGVEGFASYPFNKFNRVDFITGWYDFKTERNVFIEEVGDVRIEDPTRSGTLFGVGVGLSRDTIRYLPFGPLAGEGYSINYTHYLPIGSYLERRNLTADLRHYTKLGRRSLLAQRLVSLNSFGDDPNFFWAGGDNTVRGIPYRSMVGTRVFFYNAELRFPLIDALVTPVLGFGGIRGLFFFNMGNAWTPQFEEFGGDFGFFTDGKFGPNGRSSYGFGININFFLPLHIDYSWKNFNRDDPNTSSNETKSGVDFWIGFDF
ncbi:MAG TPA: hypothetical protein VGB99_10005 [Acidobacteriota bacterium]